MSESDKQTPQSEQRPEPTPEPSDRTPARELKEVFSKEYVSELRAESKAWQKKHQALLTERDKIQQDTQQQLAQTQRSARERIIRAELKALALKAGLRDLDGLKLADLSTVTLKEDDTLDGADEMLAALKEAKPYLFAESERSTSPSKTPPAPNPPVPANVMGLSQDEYERLRHAFLHAA